MNLLEKYLFGAALLLALAGCSKEGGGERAAGGRKQIVPQAVFSGGGVAGAESANSKAGTKTPADGSQALTLYFLRADENVSPGYGSYGTSPFGATRATGAAAQPLTFSPAQYYQLNGKKTKMVGWYPQANSVSGGVVSWTIDGSQDVMTAPVQEGSAVSVLPAFTFGHALAQIRFLPYAESSEASLQWGRITSITVSKQRTACTFTPATDEATGRVVFSGGATATLTVKNLAAAMLGVGTAGATQFGDPVMMEPHPEDYYVRVTVTSERMGEVSTLAPLRSYPQGSVTRLRLRFTRLTYVVEPVQMGIGDWDEGGEGGVGQIPSTSWPYVVDETTIVSKDIWGSSGDPFHENYTGADGYYKEEFTGTSAIYPDSKEGSSVSAKYQISSVDVSAGRYMAWTDAVSKCKAYREGGATNWRLPTRRELVQIYELKRDGKIINNLNSYGYWSGSKYGGSYVWYVELSSGGTYINDNTSNYYVRCVRDL